MSNFSDLFTCNNNVYPGTPRTPPISATDDASHLPSSLAASFFDDDDELSEVVTPPQASKTGSSSLKTVGESSDNFVPGYENPNRCSGFAKLEASIAECNDIMKNPLIRAQPAMKPFVEMHFAFMSRHIPGLRIYIRKDRSGSDDPTVPGDDESYATYDNLSKDMTKYRFTFTSKNGKTKNDYPNPTTLFRDMYYSQFGCLPTSKPERRERLCVTSSLLITLRGWENLEVYLPMGDSLYLENNVGIFSKPGLYPINMFHPASFRIASSAVRLIVNEMSNVLGNDGIPLLLEQPSSHSRGLIPVRSFDSNSEADVREQLQKQSMMYTGGSTAGLKTILSTSDSNLSTSGVPSAPELYGVMMTKLKILVHEIEQTTESSSRNELMSRLLLLNHNIDITVFGQDPEAMEDLKTLAPPKFVAPSGTRPLVLGPNKRTGKRRRNSYRGVLSYDSENESDKDDEFESERKSLKT